MPASLCYRLVPRSLGRSRGMPLVSSLLHTPCRSGSPHGVRGTVYGVAAAPLYAVITSGGAAGRWAVTSDVAVVIGDACSEEGKKKAL